MDGEKAVEELADELKGPNFNWDSEPAKAAAELAHNLPKFQTYSFYYLAVALELRRRLDEIREEEAIRSKRSPTKSGKGKKKVEDYTSEDYLALINNIIRKTKRPKSVSKNGAAVEPALVISYYLALEKVAKDQPREFEEELEIYPSEEDLDSEAGETEASELESEEPETNQGTEDD